MKRLIFLVVFSCIFQKALCQINPVLPSSNSYAPQIYHAKLLGITKPIRSMSPKSIHVVNEMEIEQEFKKNPTLFSDALPQNGDPLFRERTGLPTTMIDSLALFEGLNQTGVYPPDPNGDVGINEYLQAVNGNGGSKFIIYDKTGTVLYGPADFNTIWAPLGDSGFYDPVILYDQDAQRWLLTEVGYGYSLLVAVSQTSDPQGAYYVYEMPTHFSPDYQKTFIWPDGYYFTSQDPAVSIYAMDRTAMLSGQSNPAIQRFTIPPFGSLFLQFASGADWDGVTPPPPGSPAIVLRMYDDAWGGGSDHLELWNLQVDWVNVANSNISGPTNLVTDPFDSDACPNFNADSCVLQPNGITLDNTEQKLMHRVQYRNFGSYESIVCNHIVDVNGNGLSGIRWYELRKPAGGSWSIYQQGTVASDSGNAFIGSIAQDGQGNIALGYCVSGINKFPSLHVIGRLANDPVGLMTSREFEIATGVTSYSTSHRWGDYAMMSVDPIDDSTFWFTGEYMDSSDWSTKIFKFRLDSMATTGIDQIDSPQISFTISPNPANNEITISLDKQVENLDGIVTNTLGEDVIQFQMLYETRKTLSVQALSAGMYFLKLGVQVKKLIVSR